MKRKSVYLVLAIVFFVYSVVVFVVPFEKTSVFWISYVFAVIAMGFQIPLWNRALGGNELKSKFLGFPVLHIGIIYLIIQLTLSLAMMSTPGIPTWITIVVDIVILAAACVCIISGDVARATIEETEAKVQPKVAYIKTLKANVDVLISQESNPEIKKELTSLADIIRYSEPMSNSALDGTEKQIADKVAMIANAGDMKLKLIAEVKELMNKRNIKCKALK